MTDITSLISFFEQSETRYCIFDMGRRIERLTKEQFQAIEEGSQPYPLPYMRQAWLAFLLWGEGDESRLIWFLRFPLDETGHLMASARDGFLRQVLNAVEARIQGQEEGQAIEGALSESPFAFRPKDDRLAPFHAKATQQMGQPPSKFYAHARDYLAGKVGFDQWEFVGLQGFADVVARLSSDDNERQVVGVLASLPSLPYQILCTCLENEAISVRVAEQVVKRIRCGLIDDGNLADVTAGVRALALTSATGLRRDILDEVLRTPLGREAQVLAAIAGRCWEALLDDELRRKYLEHLAENSMGQPFFNETVADLVFIPALRDTMLVEFRNPERSPALEQAMNALFSGVGET